MAAGHRESVSDPLPNPLFSNKYKKKKNSVKFHCQWRQLAWKCVSANKKPENWILSISNWANRPNYRLYLAKPSKTKENSVKPSKTR